MPGQPARAPEPALGHHSDPKTARTPGTDEQRHDASGHAA